MNGYSLKWRLVSTITLTFIILWSLIFTWLYVNLEKRLQNTLDERLSASAHMVVRLIQQLPINEMTGKLQNLAPDHSAQNMIACEVSIFNSNISVGQKVITRTRGAPKNLKAQEAGFSNWFEDGLEWRSYVLEKDDIRVVVAEKLQLRYGLLNQVLRSVLIPLVLTLILCIFFILWIIRAEFRALDSISNNLVEKKPNLSEATSYLLDLKMQTIPKEIQPFVDNILELIESLNLSLENEKIFSAFAAHELRSPLTAIKTHVQLSKLILLQSKQGQGKQPLDKQAQDRQTQDKQAQDKIIKNLEQAEYSIQRYEQLLEQLLLLSKTEIQLKQTSETTEINETLENLVLDLKIKHPDIKQQLDINWNSLNQINLPPSTLYIVLKNLIENAYIHAQSTTPIQVYMESGNLVVSDNGVGLTDNELTLLTQRFWRKSAHNTGYGLGLSLVKVLLEKNGCTINFAHGHPQGLQVTISPVEAIG